ncbi:hypothetical protein PBCVCVB1_438L [Paramecium bursaria Chlorella virus CVB-1]|nr:hypothetical protein PBCVCVB1_438L [Paramecium bursaria Chlorella virus CVB-1]
MASTNPANIINYSKADFNFVRREKTHPGYFSGYKKFFRGTKWHVFAGPAHSLEDSLTESRRYKVNEGLWEVPAVYEFAVAKTPNGKRFKTYIGTTKNLKNRHGDYLRDGDHIAHFMSAAVESGLFIMRRVRYIIPSANLPSNQIELAAVVAEQTETRFLGKFNFAWNARQNGNVAMTRLPVKTSFLCMFSRIKWVRNKDVEKFM